MDKALKWASAEGEKGNGSLSSSEQFIKLFSWVIEHCLKGKDIGKQLPISQGNQLAAEYML